MERRAIEKVFSYDRLAPYLLRHNNSFEKAIEHYKANIEISESFYPLLSVLEVGLRNQMDYQLRRKFETQNWFNEYSFIKLISRFQIDKITDARNNILREKKEITTGRVIAELSFGFWTSLFDSRFEKSLWKNLRLAFPNCPKRIRQRKTMSSKFNGLRKLRNRIFHHEPVTWDIDVIENYRKEIIDGIDWFDKDLLNWGQGLFRIDEVIQRNRPVIE